jgi:hypothetical protein
VKCSKCNYKRNIKGVQVNYDYSRESGIKGAIIKSAKKYTCPKCSYELIDVGEIDEVNKLLAMELLKYDILDRGHLKFIREHIFQESYFEFGKRVGVNSTHLRDLESFKKVISDEISLKIQMSLIKHFSIKNVKIQIV